MTIVFAIRKRAVRCLLLSLFVVSVSYPQQLLRVVTLAGKVRDEKEYTKYDIPIPGGNPDFEHYMGAGCKGAVESHISTADMSSIFPYDNRGPKLIGNGCGGFFSGPTVFKTWYNDTIAYDTISNRPFLVPLKFNFYSDCRMVFQDYVYFPLDSGKQKYSLSDPPLPTFGDLIGGLKHIYGFTLEFHTKFAYVKGAHQTFKFTGDDDVWVFVNDSLVIDLSGLHVALSDSVDLDRLPNGFLQDGGTYMFDFFSAERHTSESNIRITTSILPIDENNVGDTVTCSGKLLHIPASTFPPQWYLDWATPSVSGLVIGNDGMPVKNGSVTLTFRGSNGTVKTVTTDGSGRYTIALPRHWSGTVTASGPGYTFSPASSTVSDITQPAKNMNFIDTTNIIGVKATALTAPRLFGVCPVISKAGVEFHVGIDRPSAFDLAIYDVGGRMVWRHAVGHAGPGDYRVRWSGPAASRSGGSVYFVKLSREDAQTEAKFVAVR
jgi:fibro-slime domain-containing protein